MSDTIPDGFGQGLNIQGITDSVAAPAGNSLSDAFAIRQFLGERFAELADAWAGVGSGTLTRDEGNAVLAKTRQAIGAWAKGDAPGWTGNRFHSTDQGGLGDAIRINLANEVGESAFAAAGPWMAFGAWFLASAINVFRQADHGAAGNEQVDELLDRATAIILGAREGAGEDAQESAAS